MNDELQAAAVALCACDPALRAAGVEAVKAALPATLAALRAVCHGKSKPPLPEPETRGPVANPWSGHNG